MGQHRLYNLIEHIRGTENHYFIMDEVKGIAQSRPHLVPDSPDWFAWLAELGSFHFKGKLGHFTARQERKQRGGTYWYAYRKAHQQRYKHYLGTTDKLTLDHLERTARALHEQVLGAIPEDEALNTHPSKPTPHGLTVGPLTVSPCGVLSVTTAMERHVLNRAQTMELLSYLYDRRGSLLKRGE